MKIPTVKIESNGAALVINQSDYDPEKHTLWEDSEAAGAVETEEDTDVENVTQLVHKGGGRWIVLVNDQEVHEGTLSKVEAEALAAEY